ncbi:MAG: hypothetical protein KGV59_01375 [Tenacibaculum sp.]|nr:hypothetical protein [Tenacibaculum sp.]
MADKKITRQLSIYINGKEVKDTLGGVGKSIGELRSQLRHLNEKDPKFQEKIKELDKARKRYDEIKTAIDNQSNALRENETTLEGTTLKIKRLQKELSKLETTDPKFAETKKELDQAKASYERIQKEIHDTNELLEENEHTLDGLNNKINRLQKELQKTDINSDEFKRLNKQLADTKTKYDDISESVGKQVCVIDDLKNGYQKLMRGFLCGDMDLVKKGFNGITTGIKGVTKAAWAFITTPIGATIAGITAVLGAGKMWLDYNIAISESIKLTEKFTNLKGEELSTFRANVQGVADTFNKDFNEVLKGATTLSKQMEISFNEALNLIEKGFVKGADVNGDFLEKIREYPIQFKNAGYSAEEFVKIATQEAKGGVFSDKLLDTIKEANLSLKEMTKTQRDALSNAFGQKFTDEIAKGLKNGTKTTKQALEEIIKEANNVGLNFQQQQQLIADVFKGAGEDAGGFEEIVKQLNTALDKQNDQLTESEEATERLSRANRNLETAMADLFDASGSGFPSMLADIKAVGKEVMSGILVGIKQMTTSLETLKKKAGVEGTTKAVQHVSESVKKFNADAQKEAEHLLISAGQNIERLEKKIANASLLDKFLGTKEAYEEKLSEAKSYYNELQKIKEGSSIKLEKELNKNTGINPDNTGNGNNKDKELTEEEKEKLEEERKKRLAKKRRFLEKKKELFNKAEEEINALLKQKREERELRAKQGIDRELAEIDNKYAKEIEKYTLSEEDKKLLTLEQITQREDAITQLENEKALEKQELKKQRAAEFREELKAIEDENRIADEEEKYDRLANEEQNKENRELRLLEKTRAIALIEIDIARNKELEKVKNYEGAEKLKAEINKKYRLKTEKTERIFQENKAKLDEESKQREFLVNKQRSQEYANMFGGIAKLLGEHTAAGKAAAIAQATINTYQGVTEVWTTKSVLPEPFATASKIVSTATVLASGLASVNKIKSTSAPKGYYYGGYTGSQAIYNDEFGAVTGVVHDDEWVAPKFMTQSPKYAPTITWLENERKANIKGYYEGGHTSQTNETASSDFVTTSSDNNMNALLLEQITRLNNHLDSGIIATALIGDDNIEQLKTREIKLSNARESAKIQ